ncbi:hypothetical protein IFR05_004079 [Cadophora sp. M221]|nr:hypothetical protein IFR05_004079 [Cadophora sp. M221]
MVSHKGSKLDILPRLRSRTREILGWRWQGKGKRAETLKESTRTIETEVLRHICRNIGEEIKFPIPKVESSVVSGSSDPTILEAHVKFRFAAEPWLDVNVKKNEKKFAKELDSIYSTFPAITDRATILLAMAAWFSILCEVDDLTEKMEPMDAKRALQDARSMTWKDSGTSLGTVIGRRPRLIPVSKDLPYVDWSKVNSSHEMIQHIVREFRIYTHHILPAAIYNTFMEDVNKVFAWMITETNFRESPPPSVDAYMKIRAETVGISPFFTLVEGSLNKPMSYLRPSPSAPMTELKSLLNEIIGLQNDLIGLDKDIDAGWSVNVVTVLGGLRLRFPGSPEEKIRVLKECAREVEKMYADAIRNAIECCEAIYRSSKSPSEQMLLECIGEPEKVPVERIDGLTVGPEAPRYCVELAMMCIPSDEIENPKILISDFGESFFSNEEYDRLASPMILLPPEFLFEEGFGPSVDIWTLGCTLYEILGERPLFEAFMSDKDDVIAETISTLGDLPDRWWAKGEMKDNFFRWMDSGRKLLKDPVDLCRDRSNSGYIKWDGVMIQIPASSTFRKWWTWRRYYEVC